MYLLLKVFIKFYSSWIFISLKLPIIVLRKAEGSTSIRFSFHEWQAFSCKELKIISNIAFSGRFRINGFWEQKGG